MLKKVSDPFWASEVRAARTALGMTQAEFAVEIGISPSTLGYWEQGKNSPRKSAAKDRFRAAWSRRGSPRNPLDLLDARHRAELEKIAASFPEKKDIAAIGAEMLTCVIEALGSRGLSSAKVATSDSSPRELAKQGSERSRNQGRSIEQTRRFIDRLFSQFTEPHSDKATGRR